MAEIQTIDHGAPNWDKIFNANMKAIGNGSTTFSDTGWIKDGITLMNGAKAYTSFSGDTPSFRIIQLGSLNFMILTGLVTNLAIADGGSHTAVISVPKQFTDWFNAHQMANPNFVNTTGWDDCKWFVNLDKSDVEISSMAVGSTSKSVYALYHVFIA